MRDQDIVNDILNGTKHSIDTYTKAIQECSNQTLRSELQKLRNEAEQMQYQIYQMAEQKGWYMPAPQANQSDIQKIKNGLASTMQSSTNQNTNFTMK
ncbi:MAG: spore coat protein [Tissierellaceae bacterium]|jgi:spore coat protein CotF|nr:spore coat protein [Tissierellia bacterium]